MMDQQQIDAERAAIIAEAIIWKGTKFHDNASVKGVGCDCIGFLAGVFRTLIGTIDIPYYSKDWHLHRTEELYLLGDHGNPGLLGYCEEVAGPPERAPLPGDVVMFKFGNCFAHGAIVLAWPKIIHSFAQRPVGTDDVTQSQILQRWYENVPQKGKPRERRYFTLKRWL